MKYPENPLSIPGEIRLSSRWQVMAHERTSSIEDREQTGSGDRASLVIRTPDQRLRVFVSSTLDELAPERAAAREAIGQLRLTPVLFESGARPYPPRELYRAYLAQSDVFVGLYWQRYGWVAPTIARRPGPGPAGSTRTL